MAGHKIEAHKVTKPIQLMAVWFVALLLIDSGFLIGAGKIHNPAWIAPALVISAIVFVPLFLLGVFLMQTVFRKELQEDPYYSEWLKRREETFKDFTPENITSAANGIRNAEEAIGFDGAADLEKERVGRYQRRKGLFLVHSWRPSRTPGQVADIVVWLHQHGCGPLSKGEVEKVEYQLGPKFFKKLQVKTNAKERFRLDVSAYGPMLCLARVHVKGETEPILLERYVNFEDSPQQAAVADS